MSLQITRMTETEERTLPAREDAGLGALHTERGNLPLATLDLRARITGLLAHTELEQGFHNPYEQPLEATYVFPLPDRAAVTGMRMTADDRVVDAVLKERGQARTDYDQAIAAGKRASIAEEERPDVFTMRVGNILPGERVTVTLTLAGPLSYDDGEATFRFPLVVAPRYIPGVPLDGGQVGEGYAPDTDAVPDASRITPPVLLPGFPTPVKLGIEVGLDPGGLPLTQARSSLPVTETESGWRVEPGQRANQDFVLRLRYGDPVHTSHGLMMHPDQAGDEGTFQLTVLPPTESASEARPRPRDVVLVLDRSGSMRGWKMTAARRAAARIVDTLTGDDRFAVLAFDNVVERPPDLSADLVPGTDRHRFRAVEFLGAVQSRGGTELLTPLREALSLLRGDDETRDRALVLVTDGQVGNEDQLLREAAGGLSGVRVHTVGIDRAVNAGFLGRLAAAGGGRCELVESEDRLDEAMAHIHRRIGSPLVTELTCEPDGIEMVADTLAPSRVPDLFPGSPLVLSGRFRGRADGALVVRGTSADGARWRAEAKAITVDNPALAPVWARAHLRDLEDRYVTAGRRETAELEQRIVATSLRFSVLCRFTAYVAVDQRAVTDGATPHRVVQPVEPAAGWDMLAAAAPPGAIAGVAIPQPVAESATLGPQRMSAGGAAQSAALRRSPLGQAAARAIRLPKKPRAALPPQTFAAEAARMRAAAGEPERDRRVLLADLATRLSALLRDRHSDATGDALARLRRLLDELHDDAALRVRSDELSRLWQRMQDLLDELAGTTTPAPESSPPRRRDFWKRT